MISVFHAAHPRASKEKINGLISYSHEIMMVGGCQTAELSFGATQVEAQKWVSYGIGKHIEVYSIRGNVVWDGLINQISFAIGKREIVIGPLLDISNRIKVGWTYPNYGIKWDELAGTYAELDWKANEFSQSTFGVLDEFVSGGQGEPEQMEALQNNLLAKKADAKISETLGTGDSNTGVIITISCIGYSRLFEKQVYNREWEPDLDVIDLSEKIDLIINDNKFFVWNRAIVKQLQKVGINVVQEEEDNRTAWEIISDHVAKGGIGDDVVCGMFPGMVFLLNLEDERIRYKRVSGSDKIVDAANPDIVIPQSEISPGGFMQLTDFINAISYRVTSVSYDWSNDITSLNYAERSLKTIFSSTMLGGL